MIRGMLVRFWGVRGSVPWSSPGAGGIGCNTACLEVRDEETNEVLILDAGTGIMAPPVTYTVDGIQYITVLAGWGGAAGLMNTPTLGAAKPGWGRILTFALNGTATLKAPPNIPRSSIKSRIRTCIVSFRRDKHPARNRIRTIDFMPCTARIIRRIWPTRLSRRKRI